MNPQRHLPHARRGSSNLPPFVSTVMAVLSEGCTGIPCATELELLCTQTHRLSEHLLMSDFTYVHIYT